MEIGFYERRQDAQRWISHTNDLGGLGHAWICIVCVCQQGFMYIGIQIWGGGGVGKEKLQI